jgi:hypothetical protein
MTYRQIVEELGLDISPVTVRKKYEALLEEASIATPAWPQNRECPVVPVVDEWPKWTFSEDWWQDWKGFEPDRTSGPSLSVGARPWQITPSQPILQVSPKIMEPVTIVAGYTSVPPVEGFVRFAFHPEWEQLPQWIKRVAAAIAIDMTTVAVFDTTERHFSLEEMQEAHQIAYRVEEFAQQIIDNPTEMPNLVVDNWEGDLSHIRPSSIYTAINSLMFDRTESAILEALSSFECYEPLGPIPAEADLEDYSNGNRSGWRFTISNPEALRDCMKPWLNIWWQEVLHTIAFNTLPSKLDLAKEVAKLIEENPEQLNFEHPQILVGLADDGIYYWAHEQDLVNDIDELETITYQPQLWKGAGWYRYNFDEPEEVPVEYLGTSLTTEIIYSILY